MQIRPDVFDFFLNQLLVVAGMDLADHLPSEA